MQVVLEDVEVTMRLLKRITVARVMSFFPCPVWTRERVEAAFGGRRYVTPTEVGDADLQPDDILWLLLREEFIPARELRLIVCSTVEHALRTERAAGRKPGARSWQAVRVARRFANGRATKKELDTAAAAAELSSHTSGAAAAAAYIAEHYASFYTATAFASSSEKTSTIRTLRRVKRVLRRLDER